MQLRRSIIVSTCLVSVAPALAQSTLEDPAPPTVTAPDGRAPARAVETAELTMHASPRALDDSAITSDWPCFLGPTHDGHSVETNLRTDFDADPPTLLWSYETGSGYAQPAIGADRVVFAHRVDNEVQVDCLDPETGMRYWRHSHPCLYRGEYISDSGPRAAPVIDGGRVYVHSVEGTLLCFDLATGQVLWQRNPTLEFEVGDHFFGVVASPVVYGDLLIQNVGAPRALEGASVMAFDVATGRIRWVAGNTWGPSCASPILARVHGKDRLFVLGGGKTRPPAGGLMMLDPTGGELFFEYPFRSRTYESVIGASPVIGGDGAIFVTAAYNTGTASLRVGRDDRLQERWKSRRIGVEFTTPLLVDGFLYLIDGRSDRAGAIVCLDPATGDERSRADIVWDEEVVHRGQPTTLGLSIGNGSMIHAQGRGLVLGDNGHLLWVDLDPEGTTVHARTSLFRANETWTPPAISRGLLYVCQNRPERFGADRQPRRLLCYDLRVEGD